MLILQACEKFEYSPYEVRLNDDEKNINQRNIQRIKDLSITPTDQIKFILISDSQGFYADNEKVVNHINRHHGEAHFLLLGGDITDFGLLKEHRLIHQQLSKLKMPYVAVIGNHDGTNNGKVVYKRMYGAFDFSFTAGDSKFILLNTNYLEFDRKVPDLEWLEEELKDGQQYNHIFVLSHIYPILYEFGRDEGKGELYGKLVSKYNVSFSLHGHRHAYNLFYPFDGSIPYLISGATERLEYIVFTVNGDNITFERIQINS
ncbi:metallophosphoesterase family protein [Pontibacter deserti]|uniref:metallophosphoesterase family protein n=1 Tax=Pontibacter sp. KCTC 32443 TaxID=2764721 RepID=UPI00164D7919|nr:metallophosphoesterase [Pontibacter sp. KCTC 32443]